MAPGFAQRRKDPRSSSRLRTGIVVLLCSLVWSSNSVATRAWQSNNSARSALAKSEFDVIEGVFHDGLGTFAEVTLANELIAQAGLYQTRFDTTRSNAKMRDAISRLPESHPSRQVFEREIANITNAARHGAIELLDFIKPNNLTHVRHTAREFADAKAGDLRLEIDGRADLPVSVKTDKSRKVAVAEGQTPDIRDKWAERYFRAHADESAKMILELGFSSMTELKSYYLNVARFVAHVLIRKLGLVECEPADFSKARVTDLGALKYLLHQLVLFKSGKDRSRVIIFDRSTGEVKWESLLDGIDIDGLTPDRVSFLPSRPRGGHPIASEFGIKIDGKTVVSFQIKHKRGSARNTIHRYEFSDITTRLRF